MDNAHPYELCVLGLGYIGLPTASMFATRGLRVLGVDTNREILAALEAGQPHIEEPGLATLVEAATRSGRLLVAASPAPSEAFILAVPTPARETTAGAKGADLTAVRAATAAMATVLQPGNLVILESTCPPGTTRDVIAPIVEEETGLVAGRDYHLAHCPERVLPGSILKELIGNTRVVGGFTEACADRAAALYGRFVEGGCLKTDDLTAEMVKLMENTYRDVNIALANELANIAEKIGFDAHEVISLANRHPRVQIHTPGPGVGGHCIPIDPWFIHEAAPEEARLIALARRINDERPARVVETLRAFIGGLEGRKVALLGVAYKPNVDDARESPAEALWQQLEAAGAQTRCHDPHVKRGFPVAMVSFEDAVRDADVLLFACAHLAYAQLDPVALRRQTSASLVYDVSRAVDAEAFAAAGFTVQRQGRA